MLDILKKVAGGEGSSELGPLVRFFAAAVAFLFALLLTVIGVWLLGTLWRVSAESPFGIWAFPVSVLFACALGALVWHLSGLLSHRKPAIGNQTGKMVDAIVGNVAPRISPAEPMAAEVAAPTAAGLRDLIEQAIARAKAKHDRSELDRAENLNNQYARQFSLADPDGPGWTRDMGTRIAELRKRMS